VDRRVRLVPAIVALAACGGRGAPAREAVDARLVETARVALQEAPADPIADIESVRDRPGGGFILADRQASRVRLFDASGSIDGVLGGPGDGPGELREPTAALELDDGRVLVVQRADPRLTVFSPGAAPAVRSVPGHYGFLIEHAGPRILVGAATRETRFALISLDAESAISFGVIDPAVDATPLWIWFATNSAAVLGDVIAVSTSFFPRIRLFDLDGDSIGALGEPPADWVPPSAPPISDVSGPGDRERIEAWARSFTVVRRIVALGDSLLVVEYGRHEPAEGDPYRVVPTSADIYRLDGARIASGIDLPGPVVGGGRRLLVLVAEPPDPWTVAAYEWRDPRGAIE